MLIGQYTDAGKATIGQIFFTHNKYPLLKNAPDLLKSNTILSLQKGKHTAVSLLLH